MLLTQYHHQFRDMLVEKRAMVPVEEQHEVFSAIRAMPGQAREASMMKYAWGPDVRKYLAQYALNPWVYSGVKRKAEAAAAAVMQVVHRDDPTKVEKNHPMLDLLGKYGMTDESMNAVEFWLNHYTYLELCGNSYWYWSNHTGRRDRDGNLTVDEVYLLPPWQVRIVPGSRLQVSHYEFWVYGHKYDLSPLDVTHHRGPNPFNRYYGLCAMEPLSLTNLTDREMSEFNLELFGDDVSMPAGIAMVPKGTPPEEKDRIRDELNARHGGHRRTAVMEGEPGSLAYYATGLSPLESSFHDGRKLNRQAIYECLGIPQAMLSETSTEALARVAERQFLETVSYCLDWSARKLTADSLLFWPNSQNLAVLFEDIRIRAADWVQLEKKYRTLGQYVEIGDLLSRDLGVKVKERTNAGTMVNESPAGAGFGQADNPGSDDPQPDKG